MQISNKPYPKTMKKIRLIPLLLLSMQLLSSCVGTSENNPIDKRVEEILSQMTLEEKVGQMAQITLDVVGEGASRYESYEPFRLDSAKLRTAILQYHVGSILNTSNNRARTPEVWHRIVSQIQEVAMNETRIKVPIIYGVDAIHGATYTAGATMFPQQITLAAAFNPAHAEKMGEVTAYETRASAIPWNFSPVLDLGADPRFSRQFEGFGEDPYLGSVLGVALVKGYEGENNDVSDPTRVASCIKHFLGYSTPLSGKDRTPAYIPENILREYHIPAFKAAIDAGAKTIMINSGVINGVSVHASYEILTKLLREELGFKGMVVTDWADIENLHNRDRIAPTIKDAVRQAINAGIDMSMIAYEYEPFCESLVELVKEGAVKESRVNDAVRNILRLKLELGLFERPVTNFKDYPKFGSAEFAQAAYDASAEAITLLKNEGGILPLSAGKKLLVVGPNGNSMRPMNGGWTYSWQGEKTDEFAGEYNTFYEALSNEFGAVNVNYVAGVEYEPVIEYYRERKKDFEKVLPAARQADVIILCVGENTYTEGPGNLSDLQLSDLQLELAHEVAKAGKPVVLVLNEGRPRVIAKIEAKMDAVVQTYLPGNYGGDALAHILSGKVNPSGKLPYTYPKAPNSLGTYYHKPSEVVKTMAGVYNYAGDFAPQYEFGFGLSYTTFVYSNMKVSNTQFGANDQLTVSIDVTNSGNRVGKESVLFYTSDLFASLTPDVKRLRRFDKIELQPGESKTVTFTIGASDLAFVNTQNEWITEPGDFDFLIGDQKLTVTYK